MVSYLMTMAVVAVNVIDNDVQTTTGLSTFECLRICIKDVTCSAVFSQPDTMECGISEKVYQSSNDTGLSAHTGMTLFMWELDGCSLASGWRYHRASGLCYTRSSYKTDITTATAGCDSVGARLAVVDTEQKNDHLLTLHPNKKFRSWIGLRRSGGTWKWSSGTSLGPFTGWKSPHPVEGKNCAVMSGYVQGWSSFKCGNSPNVNYLCDREFVDPFRP